MAEKSDKIEENGENPEKNSPLKSEELAALADSLEAEGSSINSEDYWFLKLNGNHD